MKEGKYFETSIQINASIEAVWDALVNPEITRQYMYGCDVVSDWKPGSPVSWRGAADGVTYVVGKVVKFEPHSRLALTTFDPNAPYPDIPENHLVGTYELAHEDGVTTLSISQGDFASVADGENRWASAEGAWNMSLQALKKLLEAL